MARRAEPNAKKVLGFLRELCDAVLLHLRDLDAEMKQPSSHERGRRIAVLAGRLEWANDRCRYFGLGIDFRKDPQSKARETKLAEHLDPWTERARIRAELLAWLAGDRPEDAGIVCGRRVVPEIDRICPEGKE